MGRDGATILGHRGPPSSRVHTLSRVSESVTFSTPIGPVSISESSRDWLVPLVRHDGWKEEADAIETADDGKPIELDPVGRLAVRALLVGFATLPDDLAQLRDAFARR